MTQRWKLTIEYHGGGFVGWQVQDNGRSVQGAIEEAIFKLSGETIRVTSAGRTDAGVHALGQVAHFDLEKVFDASTIRDALNAHLRPEQVAVLTAEAVPDSFDARFSAIRRHYRYRILNRRSPPALEQGLVWHIVKRLDVDAMNEAAQALVGKHDFTTFRAVACQAKSPIRTMERLEVTREGDVVMVDASARSFLHHQIRNITGTLALVGDRKWTKDDVSRALEACDRSAGGPTAPPQGLYFAAVEY